MIETDGGVISEHARVLVAAVLLFALSSPALSTADTVYEYAVDAVRPVSVTEVVGANTCFRYKLLR